MPMLTPADLPVPAEFDQKFPDPDEQAAQQRALARNVAQRERWQSECDTRAAANAPKPTQKIERMSNDEARALLQSGDEAKRIIDVSTRKLQDDLAAAEQSIRAADTAYQSAQALNRESWALFVSTPGSPRPGDIADALNELRAVIDAAYAQRDEIKRLHDECAASYQTAIAQARAAIDKASHHCLLNSAERLAGRIETFVNDAAMAQGALRGLLDYAIMAKDNTAVSFINLALLGQLTRSPQEEADRRTAQANAAERLRATWRQRSVFCGTPSNDF
jgi:hypothetical protein